MEFEDDTITRDENTRLAATKKLTLQPITPDLTDGNLPDSARVAEHLRSPAVANAPNDIEQNSQPIQPAHGLIDPSVTQKVPARRHIFQGVVAAILFVVLMLALLLAYTAVS